MKCYAKPLNCQHCHCHIDQWVYDFSINTYGFHLCIPCQKLFENYSVITTRETIQLYFSLKDRGVPAELEKFDGHKAIDIAVVEARVNIEVDGPQHNSDYRQALADLKRTYYSFRKGYLTLRIPNSLVRNNLQETAEYITEFLVLNKGKIGKVSKSA